jgi:hypothetical protein
MRKYRKITISIFLIILVANVFLTGCTKYGSGFLSPYAQYTISQFSLIRGRLATSYALNTDGSNIPLHMKWTHIYDSTGAIVDAIFSKKYSVGVWTAAYDPLTDTTYNTIFAKRSMDSLPPIVVNESNGTVEANSGTLYLPLGTYTMDLQVSNTSGTESLKKALQIIIQDGKSLETSPETGNYSNGLLLANTPTGAKRGALFNGANNPYDLEVIRRLADTPNLLILKIMDRNGVPFDPKLGEIAKRPNSGLNPTPPFLQNLQDYAPDTYTPTDTALTLKYPLVPFPIISLGNGFNMYYRIPTAFVHIDSTANWSSNSSGVYYQGVSDPHYLGVYKDGIYDYSLRIPMRIQVPGTYEIDIKILNVTHK